MSNFEVLDGGRIPEEQRSPLPHEAEFLNAITYVDNYCHTRGEIGGLDTGFAQMTEHLEGLQSGLTLIAGQANSGKTGLMVQLALQIAQQNKDAYCIYHSLDDNMREIVPRAVAALSRIPINAVKFPLRYQVRGQEAILTRRTQGLSRLKGLAEQLGIRDGFYDGDGTCVESVEKSVKDIRLNTEKQIVLFIDNFHDLTVRELAHSSSENSKFDYLSNELSRIATHYDIPIVCTAEFRKLNGNRRPTVDDIRETTKIGYEAKAILLCYNEVGIKGESSNVYHERTDMRGKQPILEVKYGKNKFSSFKGRLFYNFYPEQSYLEEVPAEGAVILNSRVNG